MLRPSIVSKRLSSHSLTVKIVLAMLLIYSLIIGVGAYAMMNVSDTAIAQNSIDTALYHIQLLKVRLIDIFLSTTSELQLKQDISEILQAQPFQRQIDEVNIFNENGIVLFSSKEKNIGQQVSLATQDMMPTGMSEDFFSFPASGRHNGRLRVLHSVHSSDFCTLCRFQIGDNRIGGIEIFVSLRPIYARFTQNRIFYLATIFLILVAGIFLIRWVVEHLVKRPIQKVVTVMEKAKKGELSVRTRIATDPDLRRLAETFNAMAEGIQNAQERLEMQHRRELSQSNRLASLGQIISNVSHEIKNPLAGITSALHVLRKDLESVSETEIFQEIILQIGRIEQTVNRLLRYAKQTPAKFGSCRITDQIEHALRLAEHYLLEKKIQTLFTYNSSELFVYADAGQLQQVFLNLILNAVSAMPKGGKLTIRVENEIQDLASERKEVIIVRVQDTGHGIRAEELPHIFEPFYTTKQEGTGLGLSVVQGIMKSHDGKIEVQSVYQKGTTVLLTFTAYEPETALSERIS